MQTSAKFDPIKMQFSNTSGRWLYQRTCTLFANFCNKHFLKPMQGAPGPEEVCIFIDTHMLQVCVCDYYTDTHPLM